MRQFIHLFLAFAVGIAHAGAVASCTRSDEPGEPAEAARSPEGPPAGGERTDAEPPAPSRETNQAGTPAETPASAADLERFGAAAWIAGDASFFSSTLLLGEQLRALQESRAYRKLLSLPAVQMSLAQLMRSPPYREFLAAREEEPLVAQAIDVLGDAFSEEVFFYGGKRVTEFLETFLSVYFDVSVLGLRSAAGEPTEREVVPELLSRVAAYGDALRLPPLVAGFRLARPKAARNLIEKLVADYGEALPVPLEVEDGEHGFYVHLRLTGAMVPAPELDRAFGLSRLEDSEKTRETVARFRSFVRSQAIVFSAGVRGNYLLLSLSGSSDHLARLGEGSPLAASPAFAPIRRRAKPRLCSLRYAHPDLVGAGKMPVAETTSWLEAVLQDALGPNLTPELRSRLLDDVRGLIADLNRFLPEAKPYVHAGYLDRGFETYTYAAREPALGDASEPLSILARAGPSPLALVASRSPSYVEGYRRAVHWTRVAYSYFRDLAVPEMEATERAEFERFEKLFLPAFAELHETTETLLLPSIERSQTLLTIERGEPRPLIPGWPPIAVPLPAVILELRDAEKFLTAFARYREILNRLFESGARELGADRITIPAPGRRATNAGTLYSYQLPIPPEIGIEPHALVTEDYAVLSLSPEQSERLLGSAAELESSVVALSAPAAQIIHVDIGAIGKLLLDCAEPVSAQAAQGDPDLRRLIDHHIAELRPILGTLKSYTSRTYFEGEATVVHTWLHVEDIPE